ncbi:hypothetical protein OQJ18_06700 [Fluoribacter dumoffii]|uniref:hypothetical protein n=1 Tax=Fluoribacter dumoffii TaxID=463 RepID=UPI0002EEB230|nr:hypothetical protein [Fluoribacter dumoffii]MCW8385166.1 hypothetical protein [Fluoribacter dumoffii]MCW8418220.1 hypothetical protein [Fluoribacter dumoffii]MCW8453938.1 hypothetical protein [Fluoribacter dumoffii]MCW8461991.1 hypothetical protein [Fluoribacter dumoffii]MCW8482203.1 hypothetical protein [Fluoribacter dumoffii]
MSSLSGTKSELRVDFKEDKTDLLKALFTPCDTLDRMFRYSYAIIGKNIAIKVG